MFSNRIHILQKQPQKDTPGSNQNFQIKNSDIFFHIPA